MRNLLKDFWYGNLVPQEQYTNHHPEINECLRIVDKNLTKLLESLSDEQKVLFQRYDDSLFELNNIMERELFIYAFRLGGRFMAETLSCDE